ADVLSRGGGRERRREPARMTDRARRVVEIAREWVGTPYRHQASAKGAGTDCLGLLRGVWREIYGAEPEPVPAYTADWSEPDGAVRAGGPGASVPLRSPGPAPRRRGASLPDACRIGRETSGHRRRTRRSAHLHPCLPRARGGGKRAF